MDDALVTKTGMWILRFRTSRSHLTLLPDSLIPDGCSINPVFQMEYSGVSRCDYYHYFGLGISPDCSSLNRCRGLKQRYEVLSHILNPVKFWVRDSSPSPTLIVGRFRFSSPYGVEIGR